MEDVNKLIAKLLEQKQNLVWITEQKPINTEQETSIKKAEEWLIKVNQLLKELNYELPT